MEPHRNNGSAAERLLGDAELSAVLDAVGHAVVVVDMAGTVLHWNPAAERLYGVAASRALGRPIHGLIDIGADSRGPEISRAVRRGETWTGEYGIHRPDGTTFRVRVTDTPLVSSTGRVVGIVGTSIDVSEHVHAAAALATATDRLATIVDAAPLVVFVVDLAGRLTLVEGSGLGGVGLSSETGPVGVNVFSNTASDTGLAEGVRRSLAGERDVRFTSEWRGRVWDTFLNPQHDPAGNVTELFGVSVDVTEAAVARKATEASEARFRGHFTHASVGQAVTTPKGRMLEANAAYCRITGYTLEELRAWTDGSLTHPDDVTRYREAFGRLRRGEVEAFDIEKRYIRKDGGIVHVDVSTSCVRNDDGTPAYFTAVVQDITQRKRAEAELGRLALRDSLTGLANRALLSDRLTSAVSRRRRERRWLGLVVLDLDDFKMVNESHGSDAGDELLLQVGRRLSAEVRASDTVARVGGDKFAVLLDEVLNAGEVLLLAERIQESMARPFKVRGAEVFTTATVGVAATSDGFTHSLLSDAEVAMHRAKQRGRGSLEVFDDKLRGDAQRRVQTQTDLRAGIDRDELRLVFQPIFDLDGEVVVGAEALVRWQHPTRGLLAPVEFVPVAEESSLIIGLGAWVLKEACREAASWSSPGPCAPCVGPYVSVNLSARQVGDPKLVPLVSATLLESGLDPGRLVLEITESALMDDAEAALRTLRQLKQLGVRLAIDDFGTGYSSMMYLKRFPVDYLKIDRSFVSGITETTEDVAIVDSILSLARAVGVQAIAEGVETRAELDILRSLGCPFAQGYLWARPGPASAISQARPSVRVRPAAAGPESRFVRVRPGQGCHGDAPTAWVATATTAAGSDG